MLDQAELARRERERLRKRDARRRAGMIPQSHRRSVANMADLAREFGCSVATLYRHRKAGTLDDLLFGDPNGRRRPARETISADSSLVTDHGMLDQDTSFAPPATDADTSLSTDSLGTDESFSAKPIIKDTNFSHDYGADTSVSFSALGADKSFALDGGSDTSLARPPTFAENMAALRAGADAAMDELLDLNPCDATRTAVHNPWFDF